jgi:glycosyltransferase involved in cell wall biosynthesis
MKKPDLSLIIPVHNEVESLESVISEWDSSLQSLPDLEYVFIICEDGSTDGTKELVTELECRFLLINNSVPRRRGYGQAVISGLALVKTDYVLCIDSDGQIGPDQMDEAWRHRSDDHFLIGWRKPRLDPPFRIVYSKLFKVYHRLLFPNGLHDPSCPFVLGHRKLFEKVEPYLIYTSEGFWWGFVGACVKQKIPIDEIPIRHRKRIARNTKVYSLARMPGIVLRNTIGLLKLLMA